MLTALGILAALLVGAAIGALAIALVSAGTLDRETAAAYQRGLRDAASSAESRLGAATEALNRTRELLEQQLSRFVGKAGL